MWKGVQLQVRVLIDSGADANFMCPSLVRRLGMPKSALVRSLHPSSLTGVAQAKVKSVTAPVKLLVLGNHQEGIRFLVMKSPLVPLVLGRPWLRQHNPQIVWCLEASRDGAPWHATCLHSASCPVMSFLPLETKAPDLSAVLAVYHNLREVRATPRLSLLTAPMTVPSTYCQSVLFACTWAPSFGEVSESLAGGLICPSSSTVGAGFFFVQEKEESSHRLPEPERHHCTTSPPPFHPCRVHATSPSWICVTPTTWYTSEKKTSGRRSSTPLVATMNTAWCRLGSPMRPVSSMDSLTTYCGMSLITMSSWIWILVFSDFLEQHIQHFNQVLQRLLDNRLFYKLRSMSSTRPVPRVHHLERWVGDGSHQDQSSVGVAYPYQP